MPYDPLLLIPGLGETAAAFQSQVSTFSGFTRCMVARHGRFPDIRMEAGAILGEAPPRFALAGHSMGGYIALEIMRRAPERVSRLALISTRAGADRDEERERRLELIRMAEEESLESVHKALWPRLVHPRRLDDARLEAIVLGMLHETGVSRFATEQTAIMNRMNFWGVLSRVRIPTAIIVGKQDEVTPLSNAKALQAAIIGSELTTIADCGHLAPLEQPFAVNHAMQRWLSR
ncbi:MAG: hypothetical protein BGP06_07285 [Rhizobiales bacterium 65-9]|nr:alpha/beta fold hydrolase [Hyphomicrobiales bacterium]OJY35618.1 MAG: hypothetical protein BGP06_07285 [Rhizobiales bacterium 65-9]